MTSGRIAFGNSGPEAAHPEVGASHGPVYVVDVIAIDKPPISRGTAVPAWTCGVASDGFLRTPGLGVRPASINGRIWRPELLGDYSRSGLRLRDVIALFGKAGERSVAASLPPQPNPAIQIATAADSDTSTILGLWPMPGGSAAGHADARGRAEVVCQPTQPSLDKRVTRRNTF